MSNEQQHTKEVQEEINKINKMSQLDMASLHRFAPLGHEYFDTTKPYWEHFNKRFKELGGMSSSISKTIGWVQ